jgi:hypothetical protein
MDDAVFAQGFDMLGAAATVCACAQVAVLWGQQLICELPGLVQQLVVEFSEVDVVFVMPGSADSIAAVSVFVVSALSVFAEFV